jgi:hypothetical protein
MSYGAGGTVFLQQQQQQQQQWFLACGGADWAVQGFSTSLPQGL